MTRGATAQTSVGCGIGSATGPLRLATASAGCSVRLHIHHRKAGPIARKPRDIDAELQALTDKAKTIRRQKTTQPGAPLELAGTLQEHAQPEEGEHHETKPAGRKARWRRCRAFEADATAASTPAPSGVNQGNAARAEGGQQGDVREDGQPAHTTADRIG